jgi:hypothetical protein
MKVSSLSFLVAAAALGSSVAFGFTEFARGEIISSTTGRVAYDSRVFGGLNPADDYIYTLDPRLIYRREAGQIKLDSFVGLRINRYQDFNELNSEDFEASLKLSLPAEGATLASGNFETSYDEHTEVNYDVNRRLREKTFLTRLDSAFPLSTKTSVLLGGSFRRDQRNQFSDRESRDGTAGFRYGNFLGGSTFDLRYRRFEVDSTGENFLHVPLNQQSDIFTGTLTRPIYHDVRGSLTYGYRILHRSEAVALGQPTRSAGSIIGFTIDGPFLPQSLFPKIESSLAFGYQKNEAPGINDKGGTRFNGAMNISWHARERTRLFLNARRALELSINDLTVETTGVNVGVQESIGNFTNLTASAGYEQRDYQSLGRTDDVYLFSLAARYKMSVRWSASADYQVRSAASSTPTADYSRHVISVAAIYTF